MSCAKRAIRSLASPTASTKGDHELGIHLTGSLDSEGEPLGSIVLVMSAAGMKRELWRFGDDKTGHIDLSSARRFKGKT